MNLRISLYCKEIYVDLFGISDTLAMTILALRCIVKDHRHRNIHNSLRSPSVSLAKKQQSDGGFENLYNTALSILVS